MPPLRVDRVLVGGTSIHHVDEGRADAPAVVLLHGITATHRYWQKNIPHLGARHRVLALDLPGFGRSDKPDVSYSMPWFVDTLAAFLDKKGIGRAHLVGNSMGGQIAAHFALAHPSRVDRLVLCAPAGVAPWGVGALGRTLGRSLLLARLHRLRVGALLPRVPPLFVRLLFENVFPSDRELARRYTRGYVSAIAGDEYPAHVRSLVRALCGILVEPLDERRLRALATPTLVLWGARDRLLPAITAPRLRRMLPHGRLLVYRDSGHCPMLDAAERWNRDVTDFLDGKDVGR